MANPDTPQQSPDSDPLAKALGPSPIEQIFQENKAGIILGLAAIVAVVCGVILFRGLNEEKRIAAGRAYADAATVEDLDELIGEFAGTLPAGNALLRKAELLEEQGDVDGAKTALLRFRDEFPDHPRIDQALTVLGRIAEDAGDLELAANFYRQVSRESDLAAYARIHLGDLAMQEGDFEKARDIYEPIQQEYPGNPWMGLWQQRVNIVKRRLPDADAETPPPPAPKTEPAAPDAAPEEAKPTSDAPKTPPDPETPAAQEESSPDPDAPTETEPPTPPADAES